MLSGWSWTVSVMDWNASPSLNKTCLLKFSTPGPQNATVLGGGGLHRGDEVKWGHQGGLWPTRIVSLREEEIRTRTPEQRDGPVRTQGEDGCLRDEERGRRETQSCWHLDCGQPASRPWENISLLLKPPTCVCVCVWAHTSTQLHLTLLRLHVACQAHLSMGLSRREHWSGLSFPPPGDLPDAGMKPTSLVSPLWQAVSFPPAPPVGFCMESPSKAMHRY